MPDFKRLKQDNPIDSVARRYTSLSPKGKQLTGICPLCKAEAFFVDKDKASGVWKCFACKKGGDVLSLVSQVERCSLKEAGERMESWRSSGSFITKVKGIFRRRR